MLVELIGRRGCHLCDDATRELRESGVEVTERDVDSDPELLRLYDFRVPVLVVEGRVFAEGRINAPQIARLLRS
jgi:glutaredoxin